MASAPAQPQPPAQPRTVVVVGHGMVGHRFVEALRNRDQDVFCLNDSPAVDVGQGDLLGEFLAAYFPLPSSLERQEVLEPEVPAPLAPREADAAPSLPGKSVAPWA